MSKPSKCITLDDDRIIPEVVRLHLHMWGGDRKASELPSEVDLNGCPNLTDVSMLGRLIKLDLSNTVVADVSMLGSVRFLYLSGCRNIVDVSNLGGVEHLDLSRTLVKDVSALGHVKKLSLEDCANVEDVYSLRYVEDLNLNYCPKIRDVSALGSVKTLSLYGCRSIKDYSAVPQARR